MYTQPKFPKLSVEEYLNLDLVSINRHEYIAGQVYPVGVSSEKNRIIADNILTRLRTHLHRTDCRVYAGDMKLRIEALNIFYYPEISVVRDPQDREKKFKTRPCLIVEVLSPDTERIDRNEKLINYRLLDSLQEYVLVSQSEMRVDIYRKSNQQNWFLETLRENDVIKLNSVGLSMAIAEIYEDVEM